MTRICIYGAGAIGGHLAAALARNGTADVSVVARGPTLAAIKERGLTVETGGKTISARVAASDDPASFGPQDFVIVTLKAPAVPGAVPGISALLGDDTAVVTAMNGMPFWYFYAHGGPWDGHRLDAVDPGGRQWNMIGPQRAIGAVVRIAAEVVAPGLVRHTHGDHFDLGEPTGGATTRTATLSRLLEQAGFKAPVSTDIRGAIWSKLWGNLSFNPVSALTHATLDVLATSPRTVPVLRAMMVEAQAIGEEFGVTFPMDVDARIAMAQSVGPHKTSMLQDLERGRPMEIDALTGVIAEMGRLVGIATPAIDAVLALTRQRARSAGGYPSL
ncbi:MAG: 2-dehydropantoate 2-reductase [Proteobacteria bacterium]|nr:2-dehydropantoate 2-reductase [Pseudomonadota bacterium]MDA1060014.1 2-dehydropantoate 2-reductase [Pseudomonadota bacterium]